MIVRYCSLYKIGCPAGLWTSNFNCQTQVDYEIGIYHRGINKIPVKRFSSSLAPIARSIQQYGAQEAGDKFIWYRMLDADDQVILDANG